MKQIVPNYYNKFKCIADKCSHNCCIGWEIEIDNDTYNFYKTIGGTIGEKIKKHTQINTDGSISFILDKNEQCPFLNENGLCDIIIELGEQALCQICTLHPRFKNFFSSHTEIGLGICCEKAAELIICQKEKFAINVPSSFDEQENFFFKIRQTVFDIMQDRDFSFDERIDNLFSFFNMSKKDFNANEARSILDSLEILDNNWQSKFIRMKDNAEICGYDTEFEQLFCYFVFRHLTDAIEDGLYIERIKLCSFLCQATAAIAASDGLSTLSIIDTARALSAEIEYSDNNIQNLLKALQLRKN